ncbi:MAG: hypothetical protein HY275_14800, partial [Gemmatimonadetes bacterium]|nr:hypothetical protein [Gemmatimonadota bacterium]
LRTGRRAGCEREASNTAIGLAETPRAGIDATRPQAVATGRDTRTVIAAADGRRAGGYAERWGREVHAWMRFTLITTLREKGFMALGLLATLNAAANAWTTSAPRAGVEQDAVLLAVTVHARLFFILVATIWAGELVWRERDLRVDGISDALPARSSAAVIGKLAGIHGAQAVLVALLALVAFMLPRLRGAAHAPSPWFTLGWSFGALLPAVALLTQGSLAVHALVQHKVAAHVLIIAAWVGAVAAAQAGTHVGLLTVSDLPALAWSETGGVTINWAAQARAVAFDFVRGTGLVLLAIVAWSRGLPRPVLARVRTAPARG